MKTSSIKLSKRYSKSDLITLLLQKGYKKNNNGNYITTIHTSGKGGLKHVLVYVNELTDTFTQIRIQHNYASLKNLKARLGSILEIS